MTIQNIQTCSVLSPIHLSIICCTLAGGISIGCFNGKTKNSEDLSTDSSTYTTPDGGFYITSKVLDGGMDNVQHIESGSPAMIDATTSVRPNDTGVSPGEPEKDSSRADAADIADASADANPDSSDDAKSCSEIDYETLEDIPNFNSGGSDIVSVVAGVETTCVVKLDGNVICWGDVPFWMMQTIQENAKSSPYVQTTSLGSSLCLLGADGHIECHARFSPSLLETSVPSDTNYTQICASLDHGCALDVDGNVDCWGRLVHSIYKALQIRFAGDAPDGEYVQISCDTSTPCALKNDGTIACWEGSQAYSTLAGSIPPFPEPFDIYDSGSGLYTEFQALPPSQTFEQFSKDSEICAVTDDGRISCWIADQDSDFGGSVPKGTFRQVSLGGNTDCALQSDGEAVCWGVTDDIDKSFLKCLDDAFSPSLSHFESNCSMWCPYPATDRVLEVVPGGPYTQIDAGNNHACALRSDGSIACWGSNRNLKATIPSGPYRAVCGTCAIRDDDTILCWNGDEAPTEVFQQISCTKYQGGCGITDDNRVACWGDVYDMGTEVPNRIGTYSQVSVGEDQTCAITNEGVINCWNQDTGSMVGSEPIVLESPPETPCVQVSCGSDFTSCAVKEDGGITCWGSEFFNDITDDIPEGSFVQVSVGRRFACALGVDKHITCWGVYLTWNEAGGAQISTPMVAPEGSFIQLAAGEDHACGIKEDGQLSCWGAPIFNTTGPPVGTFSALEDHAMCAIDTDGNIICWGEDNERYLPAQL